jgi:hypothetical protein
MIISFAFIIGSAVNSYLRLRHRHDPVGILVIKYLVVSIQDQFEEVCEVEFVHWFVKGIPGYT